jgi:hypothetical protein
MRQLKSKKDTAQREGRGLSLFIGGMVIGLYSVYIVSTLLSP